MDAELDAALDAVRRGIGDGVAEGRAVAHDDAIDEAEADEVAGAGAEHLLRIGGGGQHAPVGTMARDHVAHVAGQQARALFVGGAEPRVGARDPLRAERNRGSVNERRADCEPGQGETAP